MARRAGAGFATPAHLVDAKALLERLKTGGPGSPLEGLAELAVDAFLDAPARTLLSDAEVVTWARRLASGWLAAPTAPAALERMLEAAANGLQRQRRRLKEVAPRELQRALRTVLERPFSPDRRTVLSLIDREPTRQLVRSILLEAVLDFGRKASAPVAGMARGLGALARMAGETMASRSGTLGSLVGAVGSEVERQLEKRAQDFVDASLSHVFAQVADALCDPRQADQAIALRLSVLDGALELTGPQLARELINLDVPGATRTLRAGLETWLATPAADPVLLQLARWVLGFEGERTLKAQLEELGVLEAARALALAQARARMAEVVETPAFASWLGALLSP
jgi:hypothetical protein